MDPVSRIEPDLREQAKSGGSELVKITVLANPGVDLSRFFEKMIVRPAKDVDRVIGLARADVLLKIASHADVIAVLTMEGHAPPQPPQLISTLEGEMEPGRPEKSIDLKSIDPSQITPKERKSGLPSLPSRSANDASPDSFFTNDTNGVKATWALGTTGDGEPYLDNAATDPLKIAVIDTGVDFANPDLNGQQARISDPSSPYWVDFGGVGMGWPIAFDDRSMSDFALDLQDYRGNWGWYMNTNLEVTVNGITYTGSFPDPNMSSTAPFTFTVFHPDLQTTVEYTVSSLIQTFNTNGGWYRFGWHPDDALASALGETAGVLVGSENPGDAWGDFNTIYVDLLGTYDFLNGDIYTSIGDEVSCVDFSSDGMCDLSGGMVYYISNGNTPIPASDWLYGLGPITDAGAVVAFMLNDVTEGGGDHGTLCAGTAIGQGEIEEMAGSIPAAAWYDPSIDGGLSQGPAKNSTLIAMGNFYQGGSGLNYYDFTALGYDGIPAGAAGDHFDQPHINSNSYGSGAVDNDAWDFSSRYMTLINRGYVLQQGITLPDGGSQSSLFVKSSGNSGPGYGTVNTPGGVTGVMAGTSTVFGQFDLGDNAPERDWVNWGDLGGFSDRGPSAMGTQAPHVLANGFFGTGNLPLNEIYDGASAVDYWSGTSRSAPETMGILALIYDGFYESWGGYPSWELARMFLMNGARTLYNDPLSQGAGLANALNSVEIAKGTRGVSVSPGTEFNGFWQPGSYQGTQYESFARGLLPGESDTETFHVYNVQPDPVTVDLEPVRLEIYDTREWNFTSLPLSSEGSAAYYGRRLFGPAGSPGSFGGADPFFLSTDPEDVTALQNADLMVVRVSYPFSQFNNAPTSNWWFTYDFAWRDTNSSGSWYNDLNGNGVRNSGERDALEMVRVNYSYAGNDMEMRVREPWKRINGMVGPNEPSLEAMDDMVIELRHAYVSSGIPTTDLKVTVELYQETHWDKIVLSNDQVTITSLGDATFDATALTASAPILNEGFEGAAVGALPAGWQAVDVAGTAGNWAAASATVHPSGQPPHSGSRLAYFNSWTANSTNQTRLEQTSGLDWSGRSGVTLSLWMYHDTGYSNADGVQVQVCTNGSCAAAGDWENVGAPINRYNGSTGWTPHTVDMSAYDGLTNVRLGLLGLSGYGNDVHIDDLELNDSNSDAPGIYEGFIKVTYQTPYEYSEYVPVIKQVFAPFDAYMPPLGGVDQPTLYDNGVMFGGTGTSSSQRAESGDWRFFFTNIPILAPPADTVPVLLAHTTWESTGVAPAATDIDTRFFAPGYDEFSMSFPDIFGPYMLEPAGGSQRAGSGPDWEYYTTSGGPDDWTSLATYANGLYGIAAQTVRWGGETNTVPYTITLGTAYVEQVLLSAGLTCQDCTDQLTFQANHSGLVGKPLEALGYGFNPILVENPLIHQNETLSFNHTITRDDAYKLQMATVNSDPNLDIDLTLYYWDEASWVEVGSSGRSDANEEIILMHPPAGEYRLDVYGYAVPSPQNFDLILMEVSGLGGITVSNLPTSIANGTTYLLDVTYNETPPAGLNFGVIFLGPAGSPTAIEVPVVLYQGAAEKTVNTTVAHPGEELTYTIELTEQSIPGTVTWTLEDSIPDGTEFVSVDGAEYEAASNTIRWTNAICSYSLLPAIETGPLTGSFDDGYISATLPFDFTFFGITKPAGTVINISTNGYATFGTSATAYTNADIPTAAQPNDFIALFWDDLSISFAGEGLHYGTIGEAPDRVFVMDWKAHTIAGSGAGGTMNFQVQIEEVTGKISVVYGNMGNVNGYNNDGRSATAGLENATGTEGARYSYNSAGWVMSNFHIDYDWTGASYVFTSDTNCQPQPFLAHTVTLVVQVPPDSTAYTVNNTARVTTKFVEPGFSTNICDISAPEVILASAFPTWDKEVWINGELHAWGSGPFAVAAGDEVKIVDKVTTVSDDPTISFTLGETFADALSLESAVADFGTVDISAGAVDWTVTDGVPDATYTITKIFTAQLNTTWGGDVVETLQVVNGPPPETRTLTFNIPANLTKDGPSTAETGQVISYTLTVESGEGIPLDGSALLSDPLPDGVEFAGNLTADYGNAWYDTDTNTVFWENQEVVQKPANPAEPRPVKLEIGSQPYENVTAPAPNRPDDTVSLVLDDGSAEDSVGVNDPTYSYQFIWLNRFTPDPALFPFNLEEIQVYFPGGQQVAVGSAIDLVVYWDGNSNPADGATLLATIPATVQVVNGWSTFTLPVPVEIATQGDVLIGVINRYIVSGVTLKEYPAAIDEGISALRSWIGWWALDPPNPAVLPPDDTFATVDALGISGNWLVRGYGNTIPTGPSSVTITFDVTVTAGWSEQVTNTAMLEYQGATASAESTFTTPAEPQADLAITKLDDPDPVLVGGELTYTLEVTNNGPETAVNTSLVDTLPDGVTFVSASTGCVEDAGVVTCDLGDLANGESVTVTIVVTAPLEAGEITNTAEVSSDVADPDLTDNTASATTTVYDESEPLADLAITKLDDPDPVLVGGELTYTLEVTNNGPDTATGVTATDTLPAEVTFVSASTGCVEDAGVVTCDLGDLADGESVTVTIVVTAPLEAGEITNTAHVSSDTLDVQMANNDASATTVIVVEDTQRHIYLPAVFKND